MLALLSENISNSPSLVLVKRIKVDSLDLGTQDSVVRNLIPLYRFGSRTTPGLVESDIGRWRHVPPFFLLLGLPTVFQVVKEFIEFHLLLLNLELHHFGRFSRLRLLAEVDLVDV